MYPESTEEVSEIMKVAYKHRLPVTPFSGGTSLEGHFLPDHGGVCIDFSHMNKIIAVHKDDLDAVVQPGVGWEALHEVLAEDDLFFGPDPAPGAQIGGMIGTNCSGTNAFRYGTMRDNVLSVTAVLADGTIVKTRRRSRKSSAGYNLTGLFVGSEGTLGLVTEATLKLVPAPRNESVGVVTFPTVTDAVSAVTSVIQEGIPAGAVELLDENQMRAINISGATARSWANKPTLLFKFAGPTKNVVSEQIARVRAISKDHKSESFEFASDADEAEELWSARKNALWSAIAAAPEGSAAWTTDVCVPVSQLPVIVTETEADMKRSGIGGTLLGHVGDGNFHAILTYDPATEKEKAEGVVHRMVERALELDGTCTGEHGVGIGKRAFLPLEFGEPAVGTMRAIKLALDPLCLLNPGKVVDLGL